MEPNLYTVRDLSEKFGISYIRAWTWTRNLPVVRMAGSTQLFDDRAAAVIEKHLAKYSPVPSNRMANVENQRG